MCECNNLPEVFADPRYYSDKRELRKAADNFPQYFDEGYELSVDAMEVISGKPNSNGSLYKCKECGQLWQIDPAPEESSWPLLAIKIESEASWLLLDDKPIREFLSVLAHGGLGSEKCHIKNCENYVLKGAFLCQKHYGFP